METGVHGRPWTLKNLFLQGSMDQNSRGSMDPSNHNFSMDSIRVHGTFSESPWRSMESSWTPMDTSMDHGKSVDVHGGPWRSMDSHGRPWTSMDNVALV